MSRLGQALASIARTLTELDVQYALVGGLAVSVRAGPRFTLDADLAVSVRDDVEAEQIVFALQQAGYRTVAVVEHETKQRLATVRMIGPAALDVVVDLLLASSGIEPEIVAAAEAMEIVGSLRMSIATTGHLIAMKLLSSDPETRPNDGVDLLALAGIATDSDWNLAEEAVTLIGERGFARGRDLVTALAVLRARP